jgi:hypothetical protein
MFMRAAREAVCVSDHLSISRRALTEAKLKAGMWDCHFRVGGAKGTDLQMADCPKLSGSLNKKCMAASLLLHLTPTSSGYFENVWAWVADHDIDVSPNGNTTTATQIDIYAARGVLIESQGEQTGFCMYVILSCPFLLTDTATLLRTQARRGSTDRLRSTACSTSTNSTTPRTFFSPTCR